VAEASPSTPLRYPVSGWIEAALFVFTIAVLSIAYVVGQGFGAHPIAVVLYATTASALALLAVTGIGPDALRIVLAPQSLMVGVGTISIEIFYYLLLHHVSPALASLFVRLAIPISFVLGWVVFGRRPRRLAMIGAAVVLAGIVPMMAAVDEASRMAAAAAGIAAALTSNLRSFAAEFHPWNRRADTVHEKLRVTGLVVLASSLVSLALTGLLALMVRIGWMPSTPLVPTAAQMLHGPTILLGVVVVGAIMTAMSVLSFSAVVKITTENFMATSAFTPAGTLLVQIAASALGIIPTYALDPTALPAMAVVIAGVLLILYAARRG